MTASTTTRLRRAAGFLRELVFRAAGLRDCFFFPTLFFVAMGELYTKMRESGSDPVKGRFGLPLLNAAGLKPALRNHCR